MLMARPWVSEFRRLKTKTEGVFTYVKHSVESDGDVIDHAQLVKMLHPLCQQRHPGVYLQSTHVEYAYMYYICCWATAVAATASAIRTNAEQGVHKCVRKL